MRRRGRTQDFGPGRLLLSFEAVDYAATVWINGEELGSHANMFREAVFDVLHDAGFA